MSKLTFGDAINLALSDALKRDPKTLLFGLGVPDPKRIFGTTKNLLEHYGPERVFDMPTSENGMAGVAIGAAISGHRPIMVHQRLDFFLLAMDQLVNSAAKWHYMFGGQDSVPVTFRLITGRGWGQGPTHSQNLQSWFAHIPGLKVVMPATVTDAYALLTAAIFDPNPVVFIENRWLHNQAGQLTTPPETAALGQAKILRRGKDITLTAMSFMTLEALRAAESLAEIGIEAEVVDLRSIAPLDWNTVSESVRRTGRLLALDTAGEMFSVSSEIVAHAASLLFSSLKAPPSKLGSPHAPVPTSPALTRQFYPGAAEIVQRVVQMLKSDRTPDLSKLAVDKHDVPGAWFTGPF